jgi:hypothetical protein
MKNMVKLHAMLRIAGIIALTALIVFTMAGCDPEPEESRILWPEALAGAPESGGIYWDNDDSTSYYSTVHFDNMSQYYHVSIDAMMFIGGDHYRLESKNGDSYTVENFGGNTFTAKVGADGKLTISDSTSYIYKGWNGTYTKRAN